MAIELNAKWKSPVPPKWLLAHLPLSSGVGQCYQAEMQFCVDFALANRRAVIKG